MLPRQHRLIDDYQFRIIKKKGNVARARSFLVNYVSNNLDHNRFGFIVTKKMGKAIRRNRAVRIVREAVRQLLPQIKTGYDMVIVLHPGIDALKSNEIRNELERVLRKENLLEMKNE